MGSEFRHGHCNHRSQSSCCHVSISLEEGMRHMKLIAISHENNAIVRRRLEISIHDIVCRTWGISSSNCTKTEQVHSPYPKTKPNQTSKYNRDRDHGTSRQTKNDTQFDFSERFDNRRFLNRNLDAHNPNSYTSSLSTVNNPLKWNPNLSVHEVETISSPWLCR